MITVTILTDVSLSKKCGATSRVKAIRDFLKSIAGISCSITNEPPQKTDVLIVCRARMHDASLSCNAKIRILDVDNETDLPVDQVGRCDRFAGQYDHFAFINYQDLKKSRTAIMTKGFLMQHPVNCFPVPRIRLVDWEEYPTVGVFTDNGRLEADHPAVIFAKENNHVLIARAKNSLDENLDWWYSQIDYIWIDDHPLSGISIKGIEARARGIPPIGSDFSNYGYATNFLYKTYQQQSFEAVRSVANQTPFNCFYNLLEIVLGVK